MAILHGVKTSLAGGAEVLLIISATPHAKLVKVHAATLRILLHRHLSGPLDVRIRHVVVWRVTGQGPPVESLRLTDPVIRLALIALISRELLVVAILV